MVVHINKDFSKYDETVKGHMKGQHQCVQSTSKINSADNAKSKQCETKDQSEQENSPTPG